MGVILKYQQNPTHKTTATKTHTHTHTDTLFALRGLAQAVWQMLCVYTLAQAKYDWWKAQPDESCELRAWVNIRWAQSEREEGVDRLHISNNPRHHKQQQHHHQHILPL